MRAFIVRPFGTKENINFDRVHQDLIKPALEAAKITGDTTGEILEAGNIREDMFELLLLADLVIADVSIDNANVFYELGIRHALRSRLTVAIRAKGAAKVPFDLGTDRYIAYDANNPGASTADLIKALNQTAASARTDSPVFLLLPKLRETDRAQIAPVPRAFLEEIERATAARKPARLGLLRWEAQMSAWWPEGFRLIGRSLSGMREFAPAMRAWEAIRTVYPNDVEANLRLGTVYQRTGDVIASDQALGRILEQNEIRPADRAEAHALMARNDKSRLLEAMTGKELVLAQKAVLRSRYLNSALENYRRAFLMDLNGCYAGSNALSMLVLMLQLIEKHPEVWAERFEEDGEAKVEKQKLQKQQPELAGALALSIRAAQDRLTGVRNIWMDFTAADVLFLTSDRTNKVVTAYENALSGASPFEIESARAQLDLFRRLDIFPDKANACLAVFPAAPEGMRKPDKVILFTGHKVDNPGRDTPRFPADKVDIAAAVIGEKLTDLAEHDPQACIGIAGGASGGDILFHEACHRLRIPSRLRLALPPALFATRSVAPAKGDWDDRFSALMQRLTGTTEVLQQTEEMPPWTARNPSYRIWGRANVWMFEEALAMSAAEVHLLALWNGEPGDGPGGTADLVRFANEQHAAVHIIDTKALFA